MQVPSFDSSSAVASLPGFSSMKALKDFWFSEGYQEAKKLRDLERENSELKKMVAELSLDNRLLKELNSKKW